MSNTQEIIMEYVCPALGVVLANLMFAAPARDLKAALDKGDLGSLNPAPWGFMLGNCIGWVLYAVLLKNMWVFFGNAPGLLISIWLNLGAVKLLYKEEHSKALQESSVLSLQKEMDTIQTIETASDSSSTAGSSSTMVEQQQPPLPPQDAAVGVVVVPENNANTSTNDAEKKNKKQSSSSASALSRHETVLMSMAGLWIALGTILTFFDAMGLESKVLMVGSVTNCILVTFYGAPLSTIFQVLKEKHTASIHIPTMILNTLTSLFWCVYGIAIGDFFLYVPNGLGSSFGVVQIVLCVTFPRSGLGVTTTTKTPATTDVDNIMVVDTTTSSNDPKEVENKATIVENEIKEIRTRSYTEDVEMGTMVLSV